MQQDDALPPGKCIVRPPQMAGDSAVVGFHQYCHTFGAECNFSTETRAAADRGAHARLNSGASTDRKHPLRPVGALELNPAIHGRDSWTGLMDGTHGQDSWPATHGRLLMAGYSWLATHGRDSWPAIHGRDSWPATHGRLLMDGYSWLATHGRDSWTATHGRDSWPGFMAGIHGQDSWPATHGRDSWGRARPPTHFGCNSSWGHGCTAEG